LGEKGNKQGESSKVILGFLFSTVDIDGIAQRLKSVKGDSHWQQKVISRHIVKYIELIQQEIDRFSKEIKVLEKEKQAQVGYEAGCQDQRPYLSSLGLVQNNPCKIVHHSGYYDQDNILIVPAHIEVVAGQ
jgi:hypothetical protein